MLTRHHIVCLPLLLAAACVAPVSHGLSEREVVGPAVPAADSAVVAITIDDALHCTGTLIGPRVVLTAAHCIDAFDSAAMEVWFGPAIYEVEDRRMVSERLAHPSYRPGQADYDIGVLVLATEAPTSARIAGLSPNPPESRAGETIRVIGFGTNETGGLGAKLEGEARIRSVSPEWFELERAPSQTCHGDSGGPAFYQGGDRVMGVTSRGDSECAAGAKSTRIDGALEFLGTMLDRAAVGQPLTSFADVGDGCAYDSDCTAGFCTRLDEDEPAACRDRCLAGSDTCTMGSSCVEVADSQVWNACVPDEELNSGGCSTSGHHGSALWVLLGLIVATRRRR